MLHRTRTFPVHFAAVALCAVAALAGVTAQAQSSDFKSGPFRISIKENDTAFLGISSQTVRTEDGRAVEISRVIADTAAEAAGLERGDVIVAFNGRVIEGSSQLTREIRALSPGDRTTIEVLRDGRSRTFDVELGRHANQIRIETEGDWYIWSPNLRGRVDGGTMVSSAETDIQDIYVCPGDMACRFSEEPNWKRIDCIDEGCPGYTVNWWGRPMLGVNVIETTEDLRRHLGGSDEAGVLISRVHEGSAAEEAGILVGDLIVAVDGQPVARSKDIQRVLKELGGRLVDLEVVRDGDTVVLGARIPEAGPRGVR